MRYLNFENPFYYRVGGVNLEGDAKPTDTDDFMEVEVGRDEGGFPVRNSSSAVVGEMSSQTVEVRPTVVVPDCIFLRIKFQIFLCRENVLTRTFVWHNLLPNPRWNLPACWTASMSAQA